MDSGCTRMLVDVVHMGLQLELCQYGAQVLGLALDRKCIGQSPDSENIVGCWHRCLTDFVADLVC